MQRRWAAMFAAVIIAIVIVGCGRVNLEDLTPEAVRTEIASRPTQARSTPVGGATPGATQGAGAGQGDREAGTALYNTWCTGCHETGRLDAPVIKGNTYVAAEWVPVLRTPGDKAKHPSNYTPVELNDNAYKNIFAYIAAQ